MAFRHGAHGTLTNKSMIWRCPTCNSENTGALEAGCQTCRAGADAKQALPTSKAAAAWAVVEEFLAPVEAAYQAWVATHDHLDAGAYTAAHEAFLAGAAWATGNREALPAPLSTTATTPPRGWTMTLVGPYDCEDDPHSEEVDTRTQQTIVAALAFYRDNQLAYGGLPGQLSAQEVTTLIEKLTPKEEV